MRRRGKTVASSASYTGGYNPRVPRLRVLGRLQTVELLAVIAAVALGLVPLSATRVESWYSTGFYPHLQRSLTPVSNAVSFAFLDVFFVMLAIAVVVSVTRARASSLAHAHVQSSCPHRRPSAGRGGRRLHSVFGRCGGSTIAGSTCPIAWFSIAPHRRPSRSSNSGWWPLAR